MSRRSFAGKPSSACWVTHVAYILRADKDDKNGASYNDGQYAVYLSVTNRDIKPDENANPVKTLRMRYDSWKRGR